MKKAKLLLWTIIILFISGCSSPQSVNSKLKIYTSVYPMYDFTSKIGKDKVEVRNLVPMGIEPHEWEPSPSDIKDLEKSDVLIYNGAGMEHWTRKVLETLQNKKLIVVEAAKNIPLLDGEAHQDGDESSHESDPHVWLNPQYAKQQAQAITNALVQADAENKVFYEENFKSLSAELDKLDAEYKSTLSGYAGREIIVAHQAFGYLCDAYGLKQVAINGISSEAEPSPARMGEIIASAKEHQVKTIFFEELISPKVAQTIADAIGAKIEVLSPIEGILESQQTAGDDYFSIMRHNLAALKTALE